MLLPASREQIRKLGERLASGDPVPNDDLHLLEELVACHMQALELGRPRLDGLAEAAGTAPLHITHRAKTTQTIIEKLRREHGMSLPRMQDLAGIRVVAGVSFGQQDALAAEIAQRFPADPREPRVVDRRARPSYGYRAVHVIVSLDGVNIEVQVRTYLQHVWADLMERLADRLGRQIRYGEPPIPPEGMTQESAQIVVDSVMRLSDQFANVVLATDPGQSFSLDEFMDRIRALLSELLPEGIDL